MLRFNPYIIYYVLILFENIFGLAPVVFTLWACGSKSELSAKTEFHTGLRSFSFAKGL